jgi:hypothetical protein
MLLLQRPGSRMFWDVEGLNPGADEFKARLSPLSPPMGYALVVTSLVLSGTARRYSRNARSSA